MCELVMVIGIGIGPLEMVNIYIYAIIYVITCFICLGNIHFVIVYHDVVVDGIVPCK